GQIHHRPQAARIGSQIRPRRWRRAAKFDRHTAKYTYTYRADARLAASSSEPRGVGIVLLAGRAVKRARTRQPPLQGTPNRRQRRSWPRSLRIRTYARKGLAGSSSAAATSSR